MEPYRDDDLSAALSALRPAPQPAFAAELDARVAAGFPRESRFGELSPREAVDRLRALKPRQILLPAGGLALTAIVVATAVVSFDGSDSDQKLLDRVSSGSAVQRAAAVPTLKPMHSVPGSGNAPAGQLSAETASSGALSDAIGELATGNAGSLRAAGGPVNRVSAFNAAHRAVERSAELTLGTEPAKVGDAAAEVFGVVHSYRGIVLRSSTSDGTTGSAAAEFELLIPSGKLGDALAAFSAIAEVRSRHEATDDITAPTVGTAEHLEDSQARIDGLLAQLAEADTEGEREAVEAELRGERRRAAALRANLQDLERRANLSRVALRIESGEAGAAPGSGGSWGIGDALHDAGQILAVAVAVTLVGLAILGPIALIALLAWLAHRAWLRRARRQALG